MSSIGALDLIFSRIADNLRARFKDYSKADKLSEISRFLSERSITTITADELYDKLVRTPDAIAGDYTRILQELIKDNLEEIQSVVALETSITALQGVIATAAKQDIAKTAIDAVKTSTDTMKVVTDGIKVGTDKIVAGGATAVGVTAVKDATDLVKGVLDSVKVGTDKIVAGGATGAKQDTMQTTLDNIDSKTPPAIGIKSAQDENTATDTYETIIDVSGSGWLLDVSQFLTPYAYDVNTGTVKITIDGGAPVERVLSIATFTGSYPGTLDNSYNSNIDTPMKYLTGLKVEHKINNASGKVLTTVLYIED